VAAYSQKMATLCWCVMLVGRLASAALTRKLTQKRLMLLDSAGVICFFALLLVSDRIILVTAAVAGLGFCMAGICPMEMMVEARCAPGARGDVHTHPHTQCTYVLEGEFVFTIEGAEHTVRPGDTLAFASGEAHGCVCPAGGVLIDVFAPMREDFIR
jgi:glyoxylate utilization-related uncharacterized protein